MLLRILQGKEEGQVQGHEPGPIAENLLDTGFAEEVTMMSGVPVPVAEAEAIKAREAAKALALAIAAGEAEDISEEDAVAAATERKAEAAEVASQAASDAAEAAVDAAAKAEVDASEAADAAEVAKVDADAAEAEAEAEGDGDGEEEADWHKGLSVAELEDMGDEYDIEASGIEGTGKGGNVVRDDWVRVLDAAMDASIAEGEAAEAEESEAEE